MKINKLLLSVIILFSLIGCTEKIDNKAVGEQQHKLFVECMELSSKISRQGDDDVSDIVKACNDTSLYIALRIVE